MGTAPHDPPFRAEHIGSLVRPEALLRLRARHAKGKASDEELRAAEDAAVRAVLELQRRLGFRAVSDGEFRRHAYADSFTVDVFSGVRIGTSDDRNWAYTNTAGRTAEARVPIVTDRLRWPGPVNVANFSFIREAAPWAVVKMTLPGPCYIHFRAGREHISPEVYPDLDLFWQDLVDAYASELGALADAGCTYVQLDETSIAKLGDPKIREGLARRGDDWRDLLALYTDVINEIVDRAPPGLSLGLHLCRGNKQGYWQAEGGYDDVARALFAKLAIRFYLLEFDSPRAGSFAPLRELPDDKAVVLGLVSSKVAELEDKDMLLRRIDEAAKIVDVDRLAVSPQCGFAGDERGTGLSFEQQTAKLARVVEVAREVWGYRPPAIGETS